MPALEAFVFRDFVDDVANLDLFLRKRNLCGGGGIVRFDLLDEFPGGGKAIGMLRLIVEALLYIFRKAVEAAFPK